MIKWKPFPRYWPFVPGFHWSPANSPHEGKWRGALFLFCFSISAWTKGWVNNRGAGDSRRHCPHYNVTVMLGYPTARQDFSLWNILSTVNLKSMNFQDSHVWGAEYHISVGSYSDGVGNWINNDHGDKRLFYICTSSAFRTVFDCGPSTRGRQLCWHA